MAWSAADAERYLDGLQPVGWKLGLERMHRLTSVLGMPQHRFASIHVVGTNGKSSVTRMAATLTQAAGHPSGATFSPHMERWAERTWIRGSEVEPERFARAVERTAKAAEVVDRTLPGDEAVTQFEAAVAASFVAMAGSRVKVAAIEAGLGGRLDATNVIPSRVTVLTSVGLDHTDWLGDDEISIATEKLAVLRHGSVLVLGEVSAEVAELAAAHAERMGARLLRPRPGREPVRLRALGEHQRRNFALAVAAAEAVVGPLDPAVVGAVAEEVEIPARLEVVSADPVVLIDAAHNPQGMGALAAALPQIADGRDVIACVGVMADKDAPGMMDALAPAITTAVATQPPAGAASARPGSAPLPAGALAALLRERGVPTDEVAEAGVALARARDLAAGRSGIVIVTGSHYLLRAVSATAVRRS